MKFPLSTEVQPQEGHVIFHGEKVPVSVHYYKRGRGKELLPVFARIHAVHPLLLKWGDSFDFMDKRGRKVVGKGQVLHPSAEKVTARKEGKRAVFLQKFQGDEKDMLAALVQEKGFRGLGESELADFCSLSTDVIRDLSRALEEEGKLRIISFSPLFLLSQTGFDLLCENILALLARYHTHHPCDLGLEPEKIRKRFNLSPKILALALKFLFREEKILESANCVALSSFHPSLSAEDENRLQEMEDLCLKGEFPMLSQKDLLKRFRLSANKLTILLSLLIERKKVIRSQEGFLLHSKWVDEIIGKIRRSGKKELSVSDFKEMTGLSRKYAIPLLELLDQMKVTRRKGSTREILR